MKKNYFSQERINILDKDNKKQSIEVLRIQSDYNGNPRYVVHFLSLDVPLENYSNHKNRKKTALKIYKANWYGGGYVLQSYNINYDIQKAYNVLHELEKYHGIKR